MSLDRSVDIFKEDRALITSWIREFISEEYKENAMKDMILPLFKANKGKKLRPMIALQTYRLIAGEDADLEKVKHIIAALEISHAASLIVDDVFDRDEMRRGEESFFVKFGTFAALSGAYNLSAFVFDLATRTEHGSVIKEMGKVGSALSSALYLSKDLVSKKQISKKFFMDVLYRKTTALFEGASKCGVLLATNEQETIDKMVRFGFCYGTAYQLRDDVLGIIGTIDDLGKLPISDIRERFQSLITIEAMNAANPKQKDILHRYYLKKEDIDIEVVRDLLVKTGGVQKVIEAARKYRDEAVSILNDFEDTRSKTILMELTNLINFSKMNKEILVPH